jgi:hypothetical protein
MTCRVEADHLVVVVTDGGLDGRVAPARGLALVDALSRTWSVDRADGTVVRAEVPLRRPEEPDPIT